MHKFMQMNRCLYVSLNFQKDAFILSSLEMQSLPSCDFFPTGNIMTVSYMSGLMLGSVVSYAAYSFTASGSSFHSETGYNFTQGY